MYVIEEALCEAACCCFNPDPPPEGDCHNKVYIEYRTAGFLPM